MSNIEIEADGSWAKLQSTVKRGSVLVTESEAQPWGQAMLNGRHVLAADVGAESNGRDTGPDPHELVLMALGACTAMTVRMYAARKGWTIDSLKVRLTYGVSGAPPKRDDRHIDRVIEIDGPLDTEQRARLLEIANKCPIHELLTHSVAIESKLT